MDTNATLTEKEKGLISTGASVAAGCQPCTAYHVKAVREIGALEDEIRQAVDIALSVRKDATNIMAGVASESLTDSSPVESQLAFSDSLLDELIAVAASFAVSCKTGLAHHLQAARDAGATQRQLLIALQLSRGVKAAAGKQVESLVSLEKGGAQASRAGDCSCQEPEPIEDTGCGCGKPEDGDGNGGVSCCG